MTIPVGLRLSRAFLLVATVACAAAPRPPSHFEDEGACPFECCTYREWTVDVETVLFVRRDTRSAVVTRLKKGEVVTGVTGVVVTLKPGRAKVLKRATLGQGDETLDASPGDVLYTLHYEGEGYFKFWLKGKILSDEVPFKPEANSTYNPGDQLSTQDYPEVVWWVKIRTRDGKVGWSRHPDNFGNKDACG
jgi:hypothetical protein